MNLEKTQIFKTLHHHINKLNWKNHMIIQVKVEGAFEKIAHIHDRNLQKSRIRELSKLIKYVYKAPPANIVVNGGRLINCPCL